MHARTIISRSLCASALAVALASFAAVADAQVAHVPSGQYRGTVKGAGGKVVVDVAQGRVTVVQAYLPQYCQGNGGEPNGNDIELPTNTKLKKTSSGRYTFTVTDKQTPGFRFTGTFSANAKKLSGTVKAPAGSETPMAGPTDPTPTGPTVPCGTVQNPDGSISNPTVSYTAKTQS
jgi:opacity protein-like surface antigen